MRFYFVAKCRQKEVFKNKYISFKRAWLMRYVSMYRIISIAFTLSENPKSNRSNRKLLVFGSHESRLTMRIAAFEIRSVIFFY